jgi:hypothetical protein
VQRAFSGLWRTHCYDQTELGMTCNLERPASLLGILRVTDFDRASWAGLDEVNEWIAMLATALDCRPLMGAILVRQGIGDNLSDAKRIEKVELVCVKPDALPAIRLREPMLGGVVKRRGHGNSQSAARTWPGDG